MKHRITSSKVFLFVFLAISLCLTVFHASAAEYPESDHPYAANSDISWTYTHPTAEEYLAISFSDDTELESNYDMLYIIDEADIQYTYSGTDLSGNTIYIIGDSFTIRLVSDSSVQYNGFTITSITPATKEDFSEPSFVINQGTIWGVNGGFPGSTLEIPHIINGQTVTALASYALSGSVFGEIILPDSITNIGTGCFSDCTNLTSISLPDNITSIGDSCFDDCSSLTSINLPNGITRIGNYCFENCSSLTSISIPDSVTSIGNYCFENCSSLTSISIPDSVTSIGDSCFDDCSSLTSINLPNGITKIGNYCFENCSSLTSISIPDSVTSIGSYCFYDCSSLCSVSLPDSLTSISSSCFENCNSLTSISLPAGITSLSNWCFEDCSSLKTVTLKATLTEIGDYTFYNCTSLTTVKGMISSFEDHTFYNCPSLTSLDLANSVETLSNSMLVNPNLLVTISQNSPLLPTLSNSAHPYKIRETGVIYNVVNSTATTVSQKVDDIVAAVIRPGMTDYQKALALHNWLTMNACYDETYSNYSASGVLLKGTGVCQSYALAYELLLDEVDIDNCLEYGYDHVWNMIKLDGEWYHVDVTWDDPTNSWGAVGLENWDFFCLSNYALQGVNNHECYDEPHIATGYKYNYAYRTGQLDERLEEVRDLITTNLLSGNTFFTFTPESFNEYDYGIANRTSWLVIQDTEYIVNDTKTNLTISYDDSTMTFTVTAGMSTPDTRLPASLKTIDEEAFAGSSVSVVWIPDGVKTISAGAFANCNSLYQIRIPASVTSISDSAFTNINGLCIFGKSGSAAQTFAEAHGFGFCPEN